MHFKGVIKDPYFLKNGKKIKYKIIKDVSSFFKLKKEKDDMTVIRNLFRLIKENGAIKDRIIRDIRNFLIIKRKIIKHQ